MEAMTSSEMFIPTSQTTRYNTTEEKCTNSGYQVAQMTKILYGDAQCLRVFGMEPALCHPSDIQNFKVAPRFLENLCNPATEYHVLDICNCKKLSLPKVSYHNLTHCVFTVHSFYEATFRRIT